MPMCRNAIIPIKQVSHDLWKSPQLNCLREDAVNVPQVVKFDFEPIFLVSGGLKRLTGHHHHSAVRVRFKVVSLRRRRRRVIYPRDKINRNRLECNWIYPRPVG